MHNTRETQMLRKARLRKGYTQRQLADLVDTQPRQYQRLEYGEREMRDATMKLGLALCSVLELDPYDIVFGGPFVPHEEGGRPKKGKSRTHSKQGKR